MIGPYKIQKEFSFGNVLSSKTIIGMDISPKEKLMSINLLEDGLKFYSYENIDNEKNIIFKEVGTLKAILEEKNYPVSFYSFNYIDNSLIALVNGFVVHYTLDVQQDQITFIKNEHNDTKLGNITMWKMSKSEKFLFLVNDKNWILVLQWN